MDKTATVSRKNYDGADLLKYIMSLFVVAMHTEAFGGVIYPLTRIAVPVFFTLSGYFFFLKCKSDRKATGTYLKARVKRLLLLYLFWFVALLPLTLYIRKYTEYDFPASVLHFAKDLFFGSTFQNSWYITATVIGLVIAALLSLKVGNFGLTVIGLAFYIPALLSSNYNFIIRSSAVATVAYQSISDVFGLFCRNFAVSIVYLVAGKIIAEKDSAKTKISHLIAGTVLSFGLLFAECFAIEKSGVTVHNNDSFIMLVPTAMLLCAIALKSDISIRNSEKLRKISIIIYCLHMPVYMVVGKAFQLLNIPDFGNILIFLFTALITQIGGFIILRLEKSKHLSFLRLSH